MWEREETGGTGNERTAVQANNKLRIGVRWKRTEAIIWDEEARERGNEERGGRKVKGEGEARV